MDEKQNALIKVPDQQNKILFVYASIDILHYTYDNIFYTICMLRFLWETLSHKDGEKLRTLLSLILLTCIKSKVFNIKLLLIENVMTSYIWNAK